MNRTRYLFLLVAATLMVFMVGRNVSKYAHLEAYKKGCEDGIIADMQEGGEINPPLTDEEKLSLSIYCENKAKEVYKQYQRI